jgi:16S rRNA U1498 N3-methylase RsmE
VRRFLLPPKAAVDDPPSRLLLEEDEFHYLAHVLRYGSGSQVITHIHPTAQLPDVKKKCRATTLRLIFHEVPLEKASLHRYLSSCPQGGFSPDELALLRSYDCGLGLPPFMRSGLYKQL